MTSSMWLRDLAAYSLQVLLLVGAGGLLARLFRLRAAAATLAFWQALLLVCVFLPLCQPWRTHLVRTASTTTTEIAGTAHPFELAPGASLPKPRPAPWSAGEMLLLVIAGGVVVRGLWLAMGLWSLRRLRRESSAAPAVLAPALMAAEHRLGVHAEFRTSGRSAAPITFGLRRPVILLPLTVLEMEQQTHQAIVYHELLHVRRRDWIYSVAEELVRAVLWFHPAIGWLIGRIHLIREQLVDQAVIGLTESREHYVEALLAIASTTTKPDLIPAPLFLRRGFLKKRVAEILKETTMTKRRLILGLAASACVLFLVGRVAISLFPLQVHAQELNSSPIQVVQGGDNLVHREALVYPRRAIEKQVEGDVALEVSVDEQGQVSDARVLSGPEELRRPCLQSVLEWRFQPPKSAPATVQVLIHFQLPQDRGTSEFVLPPVPEESGKTFFFSSFDQSAAQKKLEGAIENPDITPEAKAKLESELAELKARMDAPQEQATVETQNLKREAGELRARLTDPATAPEDRPVLKKQLAERLSEIARARSGDDVYFFGPEGEWPVNGKLTRIRSERVPQATLDALLPRLGVHVGDSIDEEKAKQTAEAVSNFDEHLRASFNPDGEGGVELVILAPQKGSQP